MECIGATGQSVDVRVWRWRGGWCPADDWRCKLLLSWERTCLWNKLSWLYLWPVVLRPLTFEETPFLHLSDEASFSCGTNTFCFFCFFLLKYLKLFRNNYWKTERENTVQAPISISPCVYNLPPGWRFSSGLAKTWYFVGSFKCLDDSGIKKKFKTRKEMLSLTLDQVWYSRPVWHISKKKSLIFEQFTDRRQVKLIWYEILRV